MSSPSKVLFSYFSLFSWEFLLFSWYFHIFDIFVKRISRERSSLFWYFARQSIWFFFFFSHTQEDWGAQKWDLYFFLRIICNQLSSCGPCPTGAQRTFWEQQGREVKRVKGLKHNLSGSDPTPSYRNKTNPNCHCISVRLVAVSAHAQRHFTLSSCKPNSKSILYFSLAAGPGVRWLNMDGSFTLEQNQVQL